MGNITSPKYPENYENGLHCLWEIEILKHQRIYLEFLDFHMSTTLENDNITCSDYINVYYILICLFILVSTSLDPFFCYFRYTTETNPILKSW